MCANRSHRAALTPNEALAELRGGAGTQFDPAVVDAVAAELVEAQESLPAELIEAQAHLPGVAPAPIASAPDTAPPPTELPLTG
jgi:HD-GYP domain-containing protein (c-di-GMP phosphodiesterase class II)